MIFRLNLGLIITNRCSAFKITDLIVQSTAGLLTVAVSATEVYW